jgi:hypothetical protein
MLEAKAVDDEEKVVYADSGPLSIKHVIKERPVRRLLAVGLMTLIIIVAVVTGVVFGKGDSGPSAPAPTLAPTSMPTILDDGILVAAKLISRPELFAQASPQLEAVGWLSTFDNSNVAVDGPAFLQRYGKKLKVSRACNNQYNLTLPHV